MGEQLREPVSQMLTRADDVLFDWAKRGSGEEPQACFDLMRTLRVKRDAVVGGFIAALGTAASRSQSTADADAVDLDQLAMQDDDRLEESIAVGDMAARAQDFCREVLAELEQRAKWAQENRHPVPGLEKVMPQGLCLAYLEGLRALDASIAMRLIMLKLFEREVLPAFPQAYAHLNLVLAESGIGRAATVRPELPRRSAGATGATAGAAAPRSSSPEADDAPVSPEAAEALQALFGTAMPSAQHAEPASAFSNYYAPLLGGSNYGDAQLLTDLSRLLSAHGTGAGAVPEPLRQRLDLVDRIFSGIGTDPLVRPALRPALDLLRYPILKAALADQAFFTDVRHPLRVLLNDAALLASSRDAPADEMRGVIEDLVRAALQRLSPTARAARDGLSDATTLPNEAVSGVETDMQQSRRERRRHIIEQARECARNTLAAMVPENRELPLEAEEFVEAELMPLLALAYLNFGRDSDAYRRAESACRDWIEAFYSAPIDDALAQRVIQRLEDCLAWARYPEERRQRVLEITTNLLRGQPDPAEAKRLHDEISRAGEDGRVTRRRAVAQRPPHELVSIGGYASIYDTQTGKARWLRLHESVPAHRELVFTDFCEEIMLPVPYAVFDEDVVKGRSRLL